MPNGAYGMNFDTAQPWNMPELRWKYGYLFVWALMSAVVIIMLFFFRRKGWIGEAARQSQREELPPPRN
jgi:magnesium transporter